MGYDTKEKNNEKNPVMPHARNWDWFIATDPGNAETILTSTNYQGKVDVIGSMRSDYYFNALKNKNFTEKIKDRLKIDNKYKKIILYAPTFRDWELNTKNISLPIKQLIKKKEYLILLRLHPLVTGDLADFLINNNVKVVSDYDEIFDLLFISDIIITDYSSLMFDAALMHKQIIFYPYDYQKYVEFRGGFYLNYKTDLPGMICQTEEELLKAITKKVDYQKLKKTNAKVNYLNDGHVTNKFVKNLKKGKYDAIKEDN